MKKIDELLDDFELGNENLNIKEDKLTKAEINRIKELTLEKTGLNKEKKFNKRFIIPLAACLILVFSFAVVFAQGALSNIFYDLFGDNIKYVNEMGTVIGESYSSNGITFNVASMLGDENSFYIVLEMIKENGESFREADYIRFDTFRLELNGSGGYTWYQIDDDDENDNKATFIIIGDAKNKIAGKKLELLVKDIVEYNTSNPDAGFNPFEFLTDNEGYLMQDLIKNEKKSSPPDDSGLSNGLSEEEKNKAEYIYDITPDKVLPVKASNIQIDENSEDIFIDNIGFAEGKLCIRFALADYDDNNIGDLYFEDINNSENKKQNEFMFSEEKNGIKYDYYVFNINDMAELQNYRLKYDVVRKIDYIEGEWKVKFKADYKNLSQKISVNKEAKISNKRYTVDNIKISPISLYVKLTNNIRDNMENPRHSLSGAVSVTMKNGEVLETGSSGSSTNSLSSTINLIFKKPIDTSQIDKVKIGDLEIELN